MATLTELVTKFSFKGSIKPLNNFNASLTQSIKLIGKTTASIAAIAGGIGFFVTKTLDSAEALNKLSRETSVSIEKIQELGYAASVSGSSTQALESTILSLSQKIGQAAQYGSREFARLGISVRDMFGNVKSADTILSEVSQRFKQLNISLQEKQSLASALGIDISLVTLLEKSGDEIDALRKKARALGVVTRQQGMQIEQFNNSITTLKFGLVSLQKQIAIGLSPAFKKLSEKFTDFLIANKELISKGVEKLANAIGVIIGMIGRLLKFIDDIVKATIGWKVALAAIGVVLAVILSPIKAIIIAVTAILAVIDDLIVAFKGGKSVIRDFFQSFFGFDITPVLRDLVGGFRNAVEIIKFIFKSLFEFIWNRIEGIVKAVKKVKEFFGGKSSPSSQDNATNNFAPGKKPSAYVPDYRQFTTTNNSVNQNVNIEVKSTDPKAAGDSVKDALQNEIQRANVQINRGGR